MFAISFYMLRNLGFKKICYLQQCFSPSSGGKIWPWGLGENFETLRGAGQGRGKKNFLRFPPLLEAGRENIYLGKKGTVWKMRVLNFAIESLQLI